MFSTILFKWCRCLGYWAVLGLTLASGQAAEADSIELAALPQLTPKLEMKSQLLARRFELVLLRHQTTVRKAAADCEAGERGACRLEDWQGFLQEIANDDESEQLYRVNRYMNHYRYRSDQRNWNRSDFWAVPEQLFDRGGDCEDFAIAKYVSLRALGIPAERLRVVVVYDRKKREDHALLLVSAANETLVLDNKYERVVSWADIRSRYQPYYSLNENSVWIHSTRT
jgi:predicted transglutaminase-like cysteine proteinase